MENMYPFERDLYMDMIRVSDIAAEEKARQQNAIQQAIAERGY